jgi:fructose-bisphosphate aldolase class II
MPLVTTTEILGRAYREGYAVGGFNGHNLETVRAIVEAAEQERSPVIVQLSRSSIAYAGLSQAVNLIKTEASQVSVPVVLHLDHGMDLDINVRCLREGFTSLMFDGTELVLQQHRAREGHTSLTADLLVEKIQGRESFEANLRMTGEVVRIAHTCGVPVEGELGKIPRVSDFSEAGIPVSDLTVLPSAAEELTRRLHALPELAEEFVRQTGCDSLAVACGSIHGMPDAVRPLDIEHLERVSKRTGVPLVLHGSSGVIRTRGEASRRGIPLGDEQGGIEEAIKRGVAKVNVSTVLQITFLNALRRELEAHPDQKDMRRLFPPVIDSLKECVVSFIRLFGSSGKA